MRMRTRVVIAGAALIYACAGSGVRAAHGHGLEPWMDDVLHDVSLRYDVWYWKLEETLHCESMHYNMAVIEGRRLGLQGEIGAAQLHPRGRLSDFYARGFDNPRSFVQSAEYVALMMSEHNVRFMQTHWSCYPR